eukprot:CAMPEP_0174292258 /NCGR_PEP_ID=MMETSP0809-20121228/34835_1 /TAXON_ID=73025 ORGANISM="Eutreptiella gymnastica-like, Strain CCMP1594" /NCGR_SAMPLE_ID=MMETSP0809 /ASSEMBLY_ACC=CAM_ASM_000658 /LENGTH=55 /DNA_ID=CAMNT_0015392201 /DNA_START=30 /DNA_END=193 /DNA_ORIENTATION=+
MSEPTIPQVAPENATAEGVAEQELARQRKESVSRKRQPTLQHPANAVRLLLDMSL